MTETSAAAAAEFDLAALDSSDEATLAIKHPQTREATTWLWTFYGPGHPKTIEQANRTTREVLREQREKEQARVNGKRWKGEDVSPDELRKKNVSYIVERTKTFTPVKIGAETIEFSVEAAKRLLLDPKKEWLLAQIGEFLRDEESFLPTSATS